MARRPDDELRLSGRNTCLAAAERRPERIVRAYVDERAVKTYRALLKTLSTRRTAYHLVKAAELDAIAESEHHEGIVLLVKRVERSLADLLRELGSGPACLLALDRVQNPNNLGAILRSAAHFDVRGVLVAEGEIRLTPSASRTAEGGAEWVDLVHVPRLLDALAVLKKAHFTCYATDAQAERSLFDAAPKARAIFLLGNEAEGLSAALARAADQTLLIPGTGRVESLNVAMAAALCAAEHFRAHGRDVA